MADAPTAALVRALFDALNQFNLEQVLSFYAPEASLTFAAPAFNLNVKQAPRRKGEAPPLRSLTGTAAIGQYYNWLLSERRRGAQFLLDRVEPVGEALAAYWHLESQDQSVLEDGQETLVIQQDRIFQHSTSFSELPRHLAVPDEPPEPAPPDEPEPEPEEAEAQAAWPYGRCLIGVELSEQRQRAMPSSLVQPVDLQVIEAARVEAVRLPLLTPPEDVAALRRVNPDLFIVVTVYREVRQPGETAADFAGNVMALIDPLYAAGVRYFEVRFQRVNEFNVWRALFGSLPALAAWFIEVRSQIKAKFPEAQVGFPAIRPPYDPSWATDTARFLAEVEPAVRAADWLGVTCLWSTPEERESPDHGRLYQRYRDQHPNKRLIITEFANQSLEASGAGAVGEYADYFRSLRGVPNLAAAFSDRPLGPPPRAPFDWVTPDGGLGALTTALGARRWDEPGDAPENFAGFASNDRPEGKDELKYDDYAQAFVRIISNPDTKTPLTIGIYGSWGMGKSFLMKRIRAMLVQAQKQHDEADRVSGSWARRAWERLKRLRPVRPSATAPGWLARALTRPPARPLDFHCVEFNAWVYSGSENLWAGLITHLYNEVEKYLGTRRTVPFRFSQNAQRAARKVLWLVLLYGGLGLLLSLLLDWAQIQAAWEALLAAAATFEDAAALGATLAAVLAALAGLPPLLNALRDLATSLTLARSEQLAALASRRDFRDKIGFMADIKDEIRMVRRLLDRGRAGVRTRLVIFIDDLDRCEPKKAVEVLEAIMLLLADEDGMPFVVVLGIDARIVVKAVEERYGKVLAEAGISGYEYLDKIVQIPFRIPPPPSAELANYVTSLLWRSPEERQRVEAAEAEAREKERQASEPTPPAPAPETPTPLRDPEPPSNNGPRLQQRPLPPELAAQAEAPPPPPLPAPPPPEVTFLPDERQAFEAYANGDHLSPNPRRVKRILNIYRVVRLLKPHTTAAQRRRMIKWVVLTEQWPFRTAWLLQACEDDHQRPDADRQLKDGDDLRAVYDRVAADVLAKDAQPFAGLDADPDLFASFIDAEPRLTVADLRDLRPYTFNLNPALQGEVTKAVARKG